jgi:6-phosphofructokinase 1
VLANFGEQGLAALVVIGGEDTLGVAARLFEEHELPVVGVPKTIDNDLSATDYTFGFDTAVAIATEAIDRLHTTAESHNRVMVVEVMGRHTGWIAVVSGIAGGADVILIPEQPITVEEACDELRRRHDRGKDFSIVVVSEGYELTYSSGETRGAEQTPSASDEFGHVRLGGVGDLLAREIEERTGYETRVTVLGHVQRGGSPTPRDRVLATRYGLKAADLVDEARFGQMAGCVR